MTPGHLGRRMRLLPVSALSPHAQLETSNIFLEPVALIALDHQAARPTPTMWSLSSETRWVMRRISNPNPRFTTRMRQADAFHSLDWLRWAFARTDRVFYVAGADNAASLHLHERSAAGVDVLSQLVGNAHL